MAHPLYELGLDGQGVNLQSFALLDSSNSYTTLVTADPSLCPGSFVIEDDGDVFQCGRCKKQFDSLTLFMRHKREGCNCTNFIESSLAPSLGKDEYLSKSFVHENHNFSTEGNQTEIHEGNAYLPVEDSTAVERPIQNSEPVSMLSTVELNSQQETDAPPSSEFLSSMGETQSSTPVITITPSVMMGDETLSFTIPIDQNSTGLMQLLTGGANSSNSAVISIPETDLAALLGSGERFHLTTSSDPSNSVNHIYLTTSMLPSIKESPVTHVTKQTSLSNDGGVLGEITIVPDGQPSHQENAHVQHPVSIKSIEPGNNHITSVLKIRETNVQTNKVLSSQLTDGQFICSAVPNQPTVIMGNHIIAKHHASSQPVGCSENSKNMNKKVDTIVIQGEDSKGTAEVKRKCEYCGKHFKKLFNLHQHIRSHTGEKPFHCLVCGRGFTQKSNVKKHMQTHKVWPKVKYTLPKEQISVKVKQTENTINGECEVEGFAAKEGPQGTSSEAVESLEYIVNNVYVCQYCDQHFENYHKLKTHLSHTHKNEKLFKCIHKDCLATFLEVEGLITHMKTHEDQIEYECQSCPKKFKNIYDLGAHQYNHRIFPPKTTQNSLTVNSSTASTTAQAKQFRCTQCNSKYASAEALNHHLLTSSHNYPCSQCKLTFVCERYLRRHLRIHGTVEPFRCELCGKMFKTENYLKSHLVIHSDSKPFHCEICKLSFNRRDKLTRHKLMHDNRKKYKCPYKSSGCEREFYRKDKLKDHMVSHSRKNYTCSKCGKNFAWPTKLRQHQVEIHPEIMANTTCSICNKIFKTKHHLKLHVCRTTGSGDFTENPKDVNSASNDGIYEGADSQQEPNKMVIMYDDDLEEEDDCSRALLDRGVEPTNIDRRRERKEDAMLSSFSASTDPEDHESTILSRYAENDEGREEEEPTEGSLIIDGAVVDMSSFENTVVVNPMDDFIHPD